MFVSDNGTFDKTTIDYLENYFIKSFKNSSYILENEIIKNKETHTNDFETVRYYNSAKQIEFLLLCNGVSTDGIVEEEKITEEKHYFEDKDKRAKLYVEDGKFILVKGSKIHTKEYFIERKKTAGEYSKVTYERFEKTISQLIDTEKVDKIDDYLLTNQDISFDKPSRVASLVSGTITGGWMFWQGLNKLREKE